MRLNTQRFGNNSCKQKMLFLAFTGALQGSHSEHNLQSFVTKHELLGIPGRWGGRWTLRSVSRRGYSLLIPLCVKRSQHLHPEMFDREGLKHLVQWLHTNATFIVTFPEGICWFFWVNSKKKTRRPLGMKTCDVLSLSYPPCFIFGPSLQLSETWFCRYPCGDTVGTLNMEIGVVRR